MSTTYTSIPMLRELKDRLVKYCAATLPVATESFDSSGNPVLTLSADASPVAGEKVVVIRIKPSVLGSPKDVLGNPAFAFGPHVIQLCTELNYAGTTDSVADILTAVELLPVLIEIGRKGNIVEWHQTANGTVPSTSAIDAGTNLKATWQDLYWNIQTAS